MRLSIAGKYRRRQTGWFCLGINYEEIYMNTPKKREEYFDVAKGIAILTVIMGHVIHDCTLKNWIFSFHMPIFFLISGYFFYKKESKGFIEAKARQLLIPYAITCIGIIISSVIVNLSLNNVSAIGGSTKEWIIASLYGSGGVHEVPFHIPQIGATWFLWALFISLVIMNSIVDSKYSYLIVISLFFVGQKSSELVWLPMSIQPALVCLLFVYLGYMCKKEKILQKDLPKGWVVAIAIIWAVSFIYGGHMYLVGCYFGNGILDIIGALCGSYIMILVSRVIVRKTKFISRILQFFGRSTLPILCFHLIEQNTFPWWKVQELCWSVGFNHSEMAILFCKYVFMLVALVLVYNIPVLRKIFSVEREMKNG